MQGKNIEKRFPPSRPPPKKRQTLSQNAQKTEKKAA